MLCNIYPNIFIFTKKPAMKRDGKILIVDDNEEILVALRIFLSQHFTSVETTRNPNLIPELTGKKSYDVIMLDMNFNVGINTGNEGLFWMREILKNDPGAIIIFLTAFGSVELAVNALKEGATDFIQKPWDDEKLLSTVTTALKLRRSREEVTRLKDKQRHLNENINSSHNLIIGNSESMQNILRTIDKVADTDANILLLGENGTGKELVAREIHKRSARSGEVFITADMGAFAETLFESELFGHTRGSFTDAREDKPGRFEIASGGTLFLDEIGNLPLRLQPKLLTVLQSREVYRVGSSIPVPIDIRLISATNQLPEKMVGNGSFREDLLYRINTITISIPPLRERRDDIPLLAESFSTLYGTKYGKSDIRISKTALKKLVSHNFPGNVRELQHIIEKAVILTDSGTLSSEDLFFNTSAARLKPEKGLNLEENEKELIAEALNRSGNNYTVACSELGISRKTLYNKIKKYGL